MGVREALLQARIASASQIDEALARQQLYGSDIVTNLLELVDLDEGVVQRALSGAYGMPLAPTGELPYAAGAAIELVPRSVASELGVYPYRLDEGVLTLVSSGPLSERATVDLGFALKVQLRALFAVAPRVKQAIARDYAFALDRRTQKALAKLDRASRRMSTEAPPPMQDVRSVSELPRPRSIAPFGFPENWSDAVTPQAAQLYAETARQPDVLPKTSDGREAPETSRSLFGHTPTDRGFSNASARPRESSEPPASSTRAPLSRYPTSPSGTHARHRHRGPYTLGEAEVDLQKASSPDVVLDVFFDFAAQFFDYSAVLALHGDHAEVKRTRGAGQVLAELQHERLTLDDYPALGLVIVSNTWALCYLGEIDPGLGALLHRDTAHKCLLLPVVVKGRAVLVLYGGCDAEPVELDAVGELLAFCPLASQALERAILARKGAGPVSPQLSTGTRSDLRHRRSRFSAPSAEERAKALAHLLTGRDGSGG